MKKRESYSPPAIGGTSLLVIFSVLCLTVFAMLSLNTALAEKRIADSSRKTVSAYYAADLQAQEIFARLRNGETVSGVVCRGDRWEYQCTISENQHLEVVLVKTEETWTVVRWQAVATVEDASEELEVWSGK
ncbi:MAG: hypothetical protein J6V25_11820 [Oscillospiraceae bacterium]|nr:hypothetical protein [Oscillospiraceae bacterium]